MSKVFIVMGPTSSGKTSLSLDLCRKYKGEIISADSRQIYKYMDVGTGKLPIGDKYIIEKGNDFWKINREYIWGYDLVNPDQYYSAYDFAEFALSKTKEILEKNKTVFLTGGTGFYIDVFTGRIKLSASKPNFLLREELDSLSLEELKDRIKKLNPKIYSSIDLNNPRRIIRALEKASILENGNDKYVSKNTLNYLTAEEYVYIGLYVPRNILYSRADKWVESIWEQGLVEETEKLIDMGYGNTPVLKGIIYRTAVEYLRDRKNRESKIERTKFDIHSYIRRQQTWFKKNTDIRWFDITEEKYKENIYNFIQRNINNG